MNHTVVKFLAMEISSYIQLLLLLSRQNILLLVTLLAGTTGRSIYHITPTPNTPCPGEPCHTLSEYVAGQYFESFSGNFTMHFLPGNHTLEQTISITTSTWLVLYGDLSSLPKVTSRVLCTWPAGFIFTGMTKLHINALAFISCGHNEGAAISIMSVQQSDISNCYFQDNINNFIRNSWKNWNGGAIYASYSTLNVTRNTFQNNSAETGGALCIYETSSLVKHTVIRGNTFQNNYAEFGGALHIHRSNVTVTSNAFHNNTADAGGALFTNNVIGNIVVSLTGNMFQNNYARTNGGVLAGILVGSTSRLSLIANVMQNNFAAGSGGVLYSVYCITELRGNTFQNNSASESGGSVTLISANTILINNTFNNNSAQYGGAILVISDYGRFYLEFYGSNIIGHNTAQHGGGIAVLNCDVKFQGHIMFVNNMASYGGGLYVHNVNSINFSGDAAFINNSVTEGGGGIHASNSTLYFKGIVTIANNSAVDGGGLLLSGDSRFYLQNNTQVYFLTNSAERKGGGIKVEESNPLSYCFDSYNLVSIQNRRNCFYQIQVSKQKEIPCKELKRVIEDLSMRIYFDNNTATAAGNDLHGGSVDSCTLICEYFEDSLSGEIFNGFTGNENKLDISSDPLYICTCRDNLTDCTGSYHSKPVYPGGTLEVPVIAHGQRNGTTAAVIQVIHSSVTLGTKPQNTINTCTTLRYTIQSSATKTTQEITLFVEGPCLPREKNTLRVYVEILPCPPGFQLSQTDPICICAERLRQFTETCDIDSKTILRSRIAEFWVGYDRDFEGLILHPHCPFHYCSSKETYFAVDDSDKQCSNNRSGLLCGRCGENLSLALGSSRCLQCSNSHLALLPVFVFAGIVLVLLLLILRLTVAAGTINGLIFYANIVAVNSSIFFQPQTTNILSVFIAWLNLDLGIETCFYNGMDAYVKMWLQFAFPFYVWALVGMIILGSHYSGRIAKKFGSNPVAVLSTLFLLSYAKLLRIILSILSYTSLEYPNNSYSAMWLHDGNIKYLSRKHAPLFIAAMVCLIFLFFPYTVVLISSQWLQAKPKLKIFSWINSHKIRPFLDAYHAPYTDKNRYWMGLMLLLRFILFLISAINALGDPSVNLLATAFITVAILTLPTVFGARNCGSIS